MIFGLVRIFSGSFRGRFGVVLGSFWDPFGVVFESFWDILGVVLGSFWDRFGIILGSVWATFFQKYIDKLPINRPSGRYVKLQRHTRSLFPLMGLPICLRKVA